MHHKRIIFLGASDIKENKAGAEGKPAHSCSSGCSPLPTLASQNLDAATHFSEQFLHLFLTSDTAPRT